MSTAIAIVAALTAVRALLSARRAHAQAARLRAGAQQSRCAFRDLKLRALQREAGIASTLVDHLGDRELPEWMYVSASLAPVADPTKPVTPEAMREMAARMGAGPDQISFRLAHQMERDMAFLEEVAREHDRALEERAAREHPPAPG